MRSGRTAISIRLKIMMIMLGALSLLQANSFWASIRVLQIHRHNRINEMSMTVAFESEPMENVISDMERNVLDLALTARILRQSGIMEEVGAALAVENFAALPAAVGGGIWFEPHALIPDRRRVCWFAFFDPDLGRVRHDPSYETPEYDYHGQMWYTTAAARLGEGRLTAWTPVYFDDQATDSLMTTVAAGIYDDDGRLAGMATVDWTIQEVLDSLSVVRPTAGSFVLLYSPEDGKIILDTSASDGDADASSDRPWLWDDYGEEVGVVDLAYRRENGAVHLAFSRRLINGWILSVVVPERELYAAIESRYAKALYTFAGLFLAILAVVSLLLSGIINRPLRKLMAGIQDVGGGNLDRRIELDSRDEIGRLAAAFNRMAGDLRESMEQNARAHAEKECLSLELDMARRLQASMLPDASPGFSGQSRFDIYAFMRPAKEVGGDFYDYFMPNDRTLAIVVADVSDKGMPAALFMVIAKTLIKSAAMDGKSPKDVFNTVNGLLCENNGVGMFVTAFMGCLDIPTGRFSYVNAGHNPPLALNGENFGWLDAQPDFVLAGMESTAYRQHELMLGAGDLLILYTDGLTEAANRQGEMYGETRLLAAAEADAASPVRDIVTHLEHGARQFAEGMELSDDTTLLALRYHGPAPSPNP